MSMKSISTKSAHNSKARKKTSSEIICENFKVPLQAIFQDYKCFLKSSFSHFGRLYIGEDHLMFISNMFGIIKQSVIAIQSIQNVEEAMPNSLLIKEKNNHTLIETHFGGFKGNNAFRIINALWKKEQISSEIFNSHEEENDLNQTQKSFASTRTLDQGNIQISLFNPEIVQKEKQKMYEIILPCSIDQFFNFFLDDNAKVYPRKAHLELKKAHTILVQPWKKSDQLGGDVREVTAQLRVKGVPFISEAGMSQVWVVKKHQKYIYFQDSNITLKIITQMSDVPYSAYFTVQEDMIITKEGDSKCKLISETAVIFNKHSYMKGTILARTFNDLAQDYQMWSQNVKERLEKIQKCQDNQNNQKKSSILSNIQFETNEREEENDQNHHSKALNNQIIGNEATITKQLKEMKEKVNMLTKFIKIILIICALQLLMSFGQLVFPKNNILEQQTLKNNQKLDLKNGENL